MSKTALDRNKLDHKNTGLQESALHRISVLYYFKELSCCMICDDVKLTAKGILFCDLIACFAIRFVSFSH